MNLVEVEQWIQEGHKEYSIIKRSDIKNREDVGILESKKQFVVGYVMRKGKGRFNPITIENLVDLETSVPDENGMCKYRRKYGRIIK